MADRGRVPTDIVHAVAVGHGPVHTQRGRDDSTRLVAVALKLGFVDKDAVKDGAEEGQVPRVLGAGDGVGELAQGVVGLLLGQEDGGGRKTVKEGGLDAGVEEGEVVG